MFETIYMCVHSRNKTTDLDTFQSIFIVVDLPRKQAPNKQI